MLPRAMQLRARQAQRERLLVQGVKLEGLLVQGVRLEGLLVWAVRPLNVNTSVTVNRSSSVGMGAV